MRWKFAAAAVLAATCSTVAHAADNLRITSGVFVERAGSDGVRIEPAATFARGDTVVTIMTWRASPSERRTIVSLVPVGLALESVSRAGLEISTDGGRTWRALDNARSLPPSITHLRWRAAGNGQLSYRAIVR